MCDGWTKTLLDTRDSGFRATAGSTSTGLPGGPRKIERSYTASFALANRLYPRDAQLLGYPLHGTNPPTSTEATDRSHTMSKADSGNRAGG